MGKNLSRGGILKKLFALVFSLLVASAAAFAFTAAGGSLGADLAITDGYVDGNVSSSNGTYKGGFITPSAPTGIWASSDGRVRHRHRRQWKKKPFKKNSSHTRGSWKTLPEVCGWAFQKGKPPHECQAP